MNSRTNREPPARVTVVLENMHPMELGDANIADAINTLSSSFSVTIVTSDPVQCRRIFPHARIIPLPRIPVRGGALAFFIGCWLILPFLRADLVYVPGVEHAPSVAMSFGKPVLCYGNCHPIQFVMNARRKSGRLSRILSRIYSIGMSTGLRRCDLVLATSPQLAEVYKSLGVPPSRVRETTLGVQLEMFNPERRKAPASNPRILEGVYHGTISKERGLEVVIEGAMILARSTWNFKIKLVGCAPEDEEGVRRLVKDAGVERAVEVLPPVPHTDIPSILWSADFGISLLEPNVYFAASPPVKVLEFLAAGIPVIANRIPTHSLYLEDGVNALLISYDADSFAKAVRTIIEDPRLRERLSENALKSAKRFSYESVHRALLEAATELVSP